MTLRLMNVCHGGTVTRSGRYEHPVTKRMETGVFEVPCPTCEGRGCPAPDRVEGLRKAVREAMAE